MNYASKQRYNSNKNFSNHKQNGNSVKQGFKITPYNYFLCQIYDKRGHIAASSYNRFNKSFNTHNSQRQVNLVIEDINDGRENTSLWYQNSGATITLYHTSVILAWPLLMREEIRLP